MGKGSKVSLVLVNSQMLNGISIAELILTWENMKMQAERVNAILSLFPLSSNLHHASNCGFSAQLCAKSTKVKCKHEGNPITKENLPVPPCTPSGQWALLSDVDYHGKMDIAISWPFKTFFPFVKTCSFRSGRSKGSTSEQARGPLSFEFSKRDMFIREKVVKMMLCSWCS
jgi:hypothetical protein